MQFIITNGRIHSYIVFGSIFLKLLKWLFQNETTQLLNFCNKHKYWVTVQIYMLLYVNIVNLYVFLFTVVMKGEISIPNSPSAC